MLEDEPLVAVAPELAGRIGHMPEAQLERELELEKDVDKIAVVVEK
jgi:hypothetical protein